MGISLSTWKLMRFAPVITQIVVDYFLNVLQGQTYSVTIAELAGAPIANDVTVTNPITSTFNLQYNNGTSNIAIVPGSSAVISVSQAATLAIVSSGAAIGVYDPSTVSWNISPGNSGILEVIRLFITISKINFDFSDVENSGFGHYLGVL